MLPYSSSMEELLLLASVVLVRVVVDGENDDDLRCVFVVPDSVDKGLD